MTTATAQATQVYQLLIKATPEQIWEAITTPEFTAQYFYGARIRNEDGRRIASGPDGEKWGDEPILESDPPQGTGKAALPEPGPNPARP